MANIKPLHTRRCRICDSLLRIARLRSHPQAVLCGSTACDVEHQKRRHNRKQQTWRRARGERDPAWRAEYIAAAGVRYQKRRMRAAAKKERAQRAPQTNGRAADDTSVPSTWAEAVAVLDRPVKEI